MNVHFCWHYEAVSFFFPLKDSPEWNPFLYKLE